jgi:hypothetical protein
MQSDHWFIVEFLPRGAKRLNEPAKLAAEFSPGWSERSEAEPWVLALSTNQARFSGRKNLSPAKAGLEIFSRCVPRAALRSTSFRCACPGLHSAASFAGSLSRDHQTVN